jgi:hypothetical protein
VVYRAATEHQTQKKSFDFEQVLHVGVVKLDVPNSKLKFRPDGNDFGYLLGRGLFLILAFFEESQVLSLYGRYVDWLMADIGVVESCQLSVGALVAQCLSMPAGTSVHSFAFI